MNADKREDLLEEADAVCDLITGLLASQNQICGWLRSALVRLANLRAAIDATDAARDEEMAVERADIAEAKLAGLAEARRDERAHAQRGGPLDEELTRPNPAGCGSGPFAGLHREQRAT